MSDDGWRSERLETTFEETRRILDAQQQTLADIDRKAMRTVRLTAVLLGVFGPVSRLTTVDLHPHLAGLAGGLLVPAIVFGVEVFNESDTFLGVSNDYVRELVDYDADGRPWEEELVLTYGTFVEENSGEIETNSVLFRAQQLCFTLGLLAVAAAVIL
jgi:hypothetical protein